MSTMINDKENLIKRIKDRTSDPRRAVDSPDVINRSPYDISPVTPAELKAAEVQLGFSLPILLGELYLQIGNGGFGPGFGILALNANGARNYHQNLVENYLEMTQHLPPDLPPWPGRLLTICDWGDGITSLLDASDPSSPVIRFHGDRYEEGPWEKVMAVEAPTLQNWIEDWLDDQPLFKRMRTF